ncbi:carboxylate-amine ligase [Chloracidobacterium aggregatum]|uniref:Putative glutamate--cysteine ligase 2 n=1 Tax=Chloracidobacterium sp. N TaxID=2821540 RepID=A0ABX8AXQ9_9BACT|nr:carboxylate-amine ligase [Chloracidobacterium aggregatum]QUV84155.1 carboxylate-amine ligase [Chloracidobacterium sp. 2]QUV87360.1 carboxylate-amine ligase [Chloracidobacterium sp. S]QUV90264.1 carboxylate-amine ligase [Chloracidobacterium sp. A]QUV93475.1 carboxylate-amine ligase [Chloracidobacterium sp. N]QUV96631.1 carboxylate-amine ligase [Chloracidobacterium sp. E]
MAQEFTLGIEEEFQIVDPDTRELRSRVAEILDEGMMLLGEQLKPEMHQSMVEVGTGICHNIQEARADVVRLRRTVATLAHKKNLRIVAASTHPFSHWKDQEITPNERYFQLIEEMQQLARALSIYGLHVHVGIENRDDAIHIMNAARYFLPHILALTTSSPFWIGRNTGLKSYRSEVFKQFPRTGIPDYFGSSSEFDNYVKLLIKTGCIDNGKKIWWDLRPHPVFPTLEFRICDLPAKVDEVIAIAALFQAVVAKLYKLLRQNMGFRLYRRMLIEENKWRAVRYGLDGKLLDLGKQAEVPVRSLILELLEFVDDVVDELGSRSELEYVHTILREGTSADRQLRIFQETNGDLHAVVDNLIAETLQGVMEPGAVSTASSQPA